MPIQPPTSLPVGAIGDVPQRGQFLIQSYEVYSFPRDTASEPQGSARAWLVNPHTGALTQVSADLKLLDSWSGQILQKGLKGSQAWMAKFDERSRSTRVFLYDFETFTAQTVATIPE